MPCTGEPPKFHPEEHPPDRPEDPESDGSNPWDHRNDGRHSKALPEDEEDETTFEDALPTTWARECLGNPGCLHDDKGGGGWTRYGIAEKYHEEVWEDGCGPTKQEAAEIYREKYWEPYGLGELDSQKVATKAFDMLVNPGPGAGGEAIRKAVNDVIRRENRRKDIKVDDGGDQTPIDVGPGHDRDVEKTEPLAEGNVVDSEARAAINERIENGNGDELVEKMREYTGEYYESLADGSGADPEDNPGWMPRAYDAYGEREDVLADE